MKSGGPTLGIGLRSQRTRRERRPFRPFLTALMPFLNPCWPLDFKAWKVPQWLRDFPMVKGMKPA